MISPFDPASSRESWRGPPPASPPVGGRRRGIVQADELSKRELATGTEVGELPKAIPLSLKGELFERGTGPKSRRDWPEPDTPPRLQIVLARRKNRPPLPANGSPGGSTYARLQNMRPHGAGKTSTPDARQSGFLTESPQVYFRRRGGRVGNHCGVFEDLSRSTVTSPI
jgi:hypothetical protein